MHARATRPDEQRIAVRETTTNEAYLLKTTRNGIHLLNSLT